MAQNSIWMRPEQILHRAVFSSVSNTWPLKACLPIKTVILPWSSVCQEDLNEHANASPLSQINSLFKTTLPLKLLYQLDALSSRRMAQSYACQENGLKLCLLGDMSNEHAELRFPLVTNDWLFQDHLATEKKYHMNFKLCLPGDLNNKCVEPRLLQCHWWMAFSRPSSQ